MKIIDDTLYLEFSEMTETGVSENTLFKAKERSSASWHFIQDPAKRSKVLIGYEALQDKYKKLIHERFGNPYEYIAKAPIKKLVETDFKAEQFFKQYRYDNDKFLPIEHVNKYTKAASWLNMLIKLNTDKKIIKKELNLSIELFWKNVCEIIKTENIDLPTTYQRLRNQMTEYQEKGYQCLIDWRFGNTLSKKINDEVAESTLLTLIEQPYVDDVIIARAYNNWAVNNGRKTITGATVGNWRRDNEAMLKNSKEGSKAWFNRYGKVIKGRRPSCPNALWEHDDNDLDLYFIKDKKNKTGNAQVFYYGRYVVAVVIDAFNDYIVGWAMAEVYSKDLIKLAYLDALYHTSELTGGWYLPHQIRSDRFGLDVKLTNDLAQFYQNIATYTPAKAHSPRGKYIEQSFGNKWHQVLRHYSNYAGQNIQSKAGINSELIETNKRAFPHESEAPSIIAEFINKMRNLQQVVNGPSKQDAWKAAFNASETSKIRQIDEVKMLELFGTMHTFHNQIGDNKVQITNRGLEVNINKQYHEFDIDDSIYMQVVGKRVHVIYEPYNMNRVLVTDGKNLRFIAQKLTDDMKMPRAIIDYKVGDRERLNKKLEAMKDHVQMFTDAKEKRKNILQLNRIDTEGLLQSGLLIKPEKQAAEISYQNNLLGTGDVLEDALNNM
jgi:hypothetical protein